MNKSDNVADLAKALAIAQGQMNSAAKDSSNPFFKSKYADLTSVTQAVRDAIAKTGLSYVQVAHDSEGGIGIETIIMHESGQWISGGVFTVPASKLDAQGFGSAATYARRYSLSAAFGVTADDDDGNAAVKAKEAAKQVITPASGVGETLTIEQRHAMEKLADEVNAFGREDDFTGACQHIMAYDLSPEEQTYMWGLITKPYKAKIKAAKEAMK